MTKPTAPKFVSFKPGTTAEDLLDVIDGQVTAYMSGKRGQTEAEFRAAMHADKEIAASYQRKVIRSRDALIRQFGAPAAKLFGVTSKAGK